MLEGVQGEGVVSNEILSNILYGRNVDESDQSAIEVYFIFIA